MAPCKGHKKSRNGCLMCKRRRVKCDETRPECMNCTGHSIPLKCAYANVSTKWETRDPSQSSGSSSTLTPEERALTSPQSRLCDICGHFHRPVLLPLQPEFPGTLPGCALIKLAPLNLNLHLHDQSYAVAYTNLSSIDLFLLNHFITSTSHTLSLSSQPDATHLWSQVIPTLIKAHPYLFHSAMAITSAHLSHSLVGVDMEKVDEIRRMEEWHHSEAMKYLKIELLNGIDEVNCHATFAGNIMCILYFIYQSSKPYHRTSSILTFHDVNHLDTAWVWFIRGAYGSVLGTWTCIHHGPVSTLLHEYAHIARSKTMQLCKNTESMLGQLNQLCINFHILGTQTAQEMVDVPTAAGYFNAVYNLRMIWTFIESSRSTATASSPHGKHKPHEPLHSAIVQSILRIPAKFWDCLEAKRPRALIIYAYIVVCWEGLRYCAEDLNTDTSPSQIDSLHTGEIGRWWASGKAENDLNVIGEILESVAADDHERALWKNWIGGAWKVFHGLKDGWWISPEEASGILNVLPHEEEEICAFPYYQTMPANGSGLCQCTGGYCAGSCMRNGS